MARIYVLLGALAVIGTLTGGAYLKGRSDGVSVEAARNAAAVEALNDQLAERDRELAALEAARLERERELEARVAELQEEAREDPNADRPAIGVGSVQRLNAIAGD